MRVRVALVVLALTWVGQASAQQAPTGSGLVAQRLVVDLGGRLTATSGDIARFSRLADRRAGPRLDHLSFERQDGPWQLAATADNVGYRDQRYRAQLKRDGVFSLRGGWGEVPLYYSATAHTVLRTPEPGVFRLDDAVQASVQGGTATTRAFVPLAQRVAVRTTRSVGDLQLTYAASRRVDVTLSLTDTARQGTQPWGVAFGQTSAVELPAPIDQRTREMHAAVEWSNGPSLGRLAYDGSWFANAVEALVVDNPSRLTDAATAPAQGRMALWPDSTAHTVSAMGALALPGRSRALAHVSLGNWLQDQALLPFTVNTSIAPIPLARPTAQARAQIVSVVSRLTSRPHPRLWLNGQYRLYDYDNKTPVFPVSTYVRVDSGTASSATGGSQPFGYVRQFLDLDASYAASTLVAVRGGYGVERDRRTFRFLDTTTEHTARASLDATGLTWGTVRLQYEHAVRTGRGLDEEVLSDIGEQVSLRQFDISDRTRDRVSALVQAVPDGGIALYASTSVGVEHRPGAAFGLQDNNVAGVNAGVEWSPKEVATLTLDYGLERFSTRQRSRQANPGPQFDDPSRDWSTTLRERVHTATLSLALPRLTEKSSAHVAYELMSSRARYTYGLAPGSTLVTPVPLAPVRNQVQRVSADLRYSLTRAVGAGVGYAYDAYAVNDFANAPGTLDSPVLPNMLSLMYQWRPYRVHSAFVRLSYQF